MKQNKYCNLMESKNPDQILEDIENSHDQFNPDLYILTKLIENDENDKAVENDNVYGLLEYSNKFTDY